MLVKKAILYKNLELKMADRYSYTSVPGRGRSCLFRPKANLPACLYESYILHYFLLERDGCTDWCMGSVGPLHLPVLPAAGCLPTS